MSYKMIAVGDNVCDCYLDDGVYYPGGNAVNVAVNCKKTGLDEVAYIGMFGNDKKAEHLKWALTQEGVTYDHSRTMYAFAWSMETVSSSAARAIPRSTSRGFV